MDRNTSAYPAGIERIASLVQTGRPNKRKAGIKPALAVFIRFGYMCAIRRSLDVYVFSVPVKP